MNSFQSVSFNINSSLFSAQLGVSLLEACLEARVEIPRFCYNQCLSIAGNCRMCLVEVKNSKKLVASCATPLISSFLVFTSSFRVKKARQAVLEFLLINHPLVILICTKITSNNCANLKKSI